MRKPQRVAADIAVLGFGGAGAVAAIEAARRGADVVIVEAAPPGGEGGSTRASAQGFLCAADAGATAAYIEALAGPETLAPDRAASWAAECCLNARWLSDIGVEVEPLAGDQSGAEHPELPGAGAIRKFRVSAEHGSLWSALGRQVRLRGIPVLHGYRAVALDRNVSGRVDSVSCISADGTRLQVRARHGVVLATGGFAAAPSLVRRFIPWLQGCDTAGSPHSVGDGLALARMVGARLSGLEAVSGPYLAFRPPGFRTTVPLEPLMPGRPRRGTDGVTDGRGTWLETRRPTRHGWVLRAGRWRRDRLPRHASYWCDADVLAGGPLVRTTAAAPGWCVVVEGLTWSIDNETEIGAGWIQPQEAAPPPSPWADLSAARGPVHQVRLSRSILNTHGGPERDAGGRVIDINGHPIPGLCGAGELGSVFPRLYQGAGNLADCLVSGRIAVRTLLGESRTAGGG